MSSLYRPGDVESCHLPGLVQIPSKTTNPAGFCSVSSVMQPALTFEKASGCGTQEPSQFAFMTLLRAYTGSNNVCCGVVLPESQASDGIGPATLELHLLKAGFDAHLSLSANARNMVFQPLSEQDRKALGRHLSLTDTEPLIPPFNTAICMAMDRSLERTLEDQGNLDLILVVELLQPVGTKDDLSLISVRYKPSFVDEWHARNILATFETILHRMETDADRPLDEISFVSARDIKTMHNWNSRLPSPVYQTLNDQFQVTFNEHAGKEAVYTTEGSLSYRELDELSTVLAVHLMELGVKPNTIVPVLMSKSRWLVCAVAAIWKAGGAVTTIDPQHPDERLCAIVDEVQAKVIITDVDQQQRFEPGAYHVISNVERLIKILQVSAIGLPATNPWNMSNVAPGDLAMVAFTSGSSGKPKGVLHTHTRLTSEHRSYIWNVEYTGHSRILQFASPAYVTCVGEIQRSFSHGATLCVPTDVEKTSGLAEFIARSRATRSYLTPSVVRTLDPKDVPSLKVLCVGGEAIPKDLEQIWGAHVHFIQIYGSTEGGFMAKDRSSKTHDKRGFCPVGSVVWLVDTQDANKLVPIGAVGDIVIEGHELALGYLNDPEKSAKSFIDPPTWALERPEDVGRRFLRNGDLGSYQADGSVSVHGRADTQVKIHGQRVELSDIESNLLGLLPSAWTVVVELVMPWDALADPILTTFVKPPKAFRGSALSVFMTAIPRLQELLPRHMIPRACLVVDQIPGGYKTDRREIRNKAAKLGRKKLIASLLGDCVDESKEPPATEKELVLARLWAKLLQLSTDDIGRRRSFVALGGDSLTAIKLVSAARTQGLRLTTQEIFLNPVLEDMANVSRPIVDTPYGVPALESNLTDRNDIPSVTRSAKRIATATDFQAWAATVGAINGGWIDHFIYDFTGTLDVNKLRRSCEKLVAAHSILRSVFVYQQGRLAIKTLPEDSIVFDLHAIDGKDLESKSAEIFAKDRVSRFGTLVTRFDLVKTSSIQHRLILRLSHAQYDGLCAGTFVEHLRLLYYSQELPPALPFTEYLGAVHDVSLERRAETYWREYLQGSRVTDLVRRSSDESPPTHSMDGEVECQIAMPNLREYGIGKATLVKAAWALTIAALSRSTDVVFGDFISGRQVPIPNVETVVGPCVNFMPIRVQLSSNMLNREILQSLQRDLISAIPYESLGFRRIIEECTSWDKGSRFSSIVNFINYDGDFGSHTWSHPGHGEDALRVDASYEEQQHDKTDLWLLCRPAPQPCGSAPSSSDSAEINLYNLHFRYSKMLYSRHAIDRIAALYIDVFTTLANSLDERSQVPELSVEQRSIMAPGCE